MKINALDAALNTAWAMEESALQQLLDIAARQHEVTPEALEAYRAKSLEAAERARVRDGVAILDARGPMFPRANLMTAFSGATSYDVLRRDLQTAADDDMVRGIILNVDSPGGAASFIGELAEAVHALRGKKPIVAYVGGMGASAGYWLASAADRVVVDPTALLGSIGVQWAISDSSGADEKKGIKTFRFVSSQSPMKNASPDTEAGSEAVQKLVDSMAQVFVEAVARNRGVATETVLKDFGKGGMFVGKDAVEAGLADALGSFESVFADLSGQRPPRNKGTSIAMSETTTETQTAAAPAVASAPQVDVAAEIRLATAAALAGERTRTAGLTTIAKAHGVADATLTAAIGEGKSVEAFALEVAALAAQSGERRVAALRTDETSVADVRPSAALASTAEAGPTSDADAAAKMAAEIAAFVPGAKTEK